MPHDHHHHHQHAHLSAEAGDARVAGAVAVNLALTLAQVVGGILSGSLALIADALHNFSDAATLIIAFLARRIARRPADAGMNFGYRRVEAVAALVNYTTLVLIALYLVYEGVMRAIDPQPIDGWLVVWVAAIALAVDLVTAALTFRMAQDSMNIRAAFLHNLADAMGSVAVIVAGALVIWLGWTWVDPAATLLIAAYILWHVRREIGEVLRVLLLATPPGVSTDEVIAAICAVEGVEDVHNLHLWQIDETAATVQTHVTIAPGAWGHADAIKARIKARLSEAFGLSHVTVEMECARHACPHPPRIGH